MLIKTKNFSDQSLEHFKELQRLSFGILEQTAAELEGGESEKEVAKKLFRRYIDAGATSFFHLPVALFGDRTALPDEWSVGKFFPKSNTLKLNQSVILDAAPLFDGYLVDTSYSFCFGESLRHQKMMRHLSHYRDSILKAVNRGQTFKAIADETQMRMIQDGYKAAHTKHPGQVLGHRAIKTAKLPFNFRYQGFDALSLSWFKFKDAMAVRKLGRHSPLWNSFASSNHKPHDGLWLVEPHAGQGTIGAKWEEILVIANGHAFWLDDEPPHVYQWKKIENGLNYSPRIR